MKPGTYQCPVCGFSGMPDPPEDNNICSCCGTEFGYHDINRSYPELRDAWIARGAPWFSRARPAPLGWDANEQLARFLKIIYIADFNSQSVPSVPPPARRKPRTARTGHRLRANKVGIQGLDFDVQQIAYAGL